MPVRGILIPLINPLIIPPVSYLREPRLTFLSRVWRIFIFLRLGLLIVKVPLPRYSAL